MSSVRNELFAGRGFFGALKRSYNRNWKSLKNRRPRRGRPTFNQREGEGEIRRTSRSGRTSLRQTREENCERGEEERWLFASHLFNLASHFCLMSVWIVELFGEARLNLLFWIITGSTAPFWVMMIFFGRYHWVKQFCHPWLIPPLMGGLCIVFICCLR